jgi:hypothetical protein
MNGDSTGLVMLGALYALAKRQGINRDELLAAVQEARILKPVESEFTRTYDKYFIDLGVARSDEELAIAGDSLLVQSIDGSLEIKLNSKENPSLDVSLIRRLERPTPFSKLYLTNVAQPGKSATLVIGREASFVPEISPAGASKISELAYQTWGSDLAPAAPGTFYLPSTGSIQLDKYSASSWFIYAPATAYMVINCYLQFSHDGGTTWRRLAGYTIADADFERDAWNTIHCPLRLTDARLEVVVETAAPAELDLFCIAKP